MRRLRHVQDDKDFTKEESAKPASSRTCKACVSKGVRKASTNKRKAAELSDDEDEDEKDFERVDCIVAGPKGSGRSVKYQVRWFGAETESQLRAKTGAELKVAAKAAGLAVSGTKAELVERILEKRTTWEAATDLPPTLVEAHVAQRAAEQAEELARVAEERAAAAASGTQTADSVAAAPAAGTTLPPPAEASAAASSSAPPPPAASGGEEEAAAARPAKAARKASTCSYCHGLRLERHASKAGCPLRKEDMAAVGFTRAVEAHLSRYDNLGERDANCLLYTSPSPRDS